MTLSVLGVPTAAGAYGGGVMRGPRALRDAGIIAELSKHGVDVVDLGDLPDEPFASDPAARRMQNLDRVVRVATAVAERVHAIVEAGDVPLVIGGDCTITLGVIAGAQRSAQDVGLAYVDGDADLSTPETTKSGILDAMGIATMLGLEGAPDSLAGLGARRPLLPGRRIALLGYDDSGVDASEAALLVEHRVNRLPASALGFDAGSATTEMIGSMSERDGLIVHFDVDVIDSTELPLAQYPHFNEGLSFAVAMEVLGAACAAPDVTAVVVTETNPDNDDSGRYVGRLVRGLASALALSRVRSA